MFFVNNRVVVFYFVFFSLVSLPCYGYVRNPADPASYQLITIQTDNSTSILYEPLAQVFMSKGYLVARNGSSNSQGDFLVVQCRVEKNPKTSDSILTLPVDILVSVASIVVPNKKISCLVTRASDGAMLFKNDLHSAKTTQALLADLFKGFPERSKPEVKDICIVGECDDLSLSLFDRKKAAVFDAKYKAIETTGGEISVVQRYAYTIKNKKSYDEFERKIEEKFSAILLPGYQIEDLGTVGKGVYRVKLVGKILLD